MSKAPDAAERPPLHLVPHRRFAPIEWAGDVKEAPPGGAITVDLGGEVMRCPVRRVIDEDTVLLELAGVPMSRNHPFKTGEFLGARRHRGMGGRDEWKAVDPRIVSEIETRKLAEERRARSEAKPALPAKRRGVMATPEEK